MNEKEVLAKLDIEKVRGDYFLKFQSEFLESYFSELSKDFYDRKARLDTCKGYNGDILYKYYVVRKLPDTPFSLGVSYDIINNYGWLRAHGISEGISLKCPIPMITPIVDKLVERVTSNIQWLYEQSKHGTSNENRQVRSFEF